MTNSNLSSFETLTHVYFISICIYTYISIAVLVRDIHLIGNQSRWMSCVSHHYLRRIDCIAYFATHVLLHKKKWQLFHSTNRKDIFPIKVSDGDMVTKTIVSWYKIGKLKTESLFIIHTVTWWNRIAERTWREMDSSKIGKKFIES